MRKQFELVLQFATIEISLASSNDSVKMNTIRISILSYRRCFQWVFLSRFNTVCTIFCVSNSLSTFSYFCVNSVHFNRDPLPSLSFHLPFSSFSNSLRSLGCQSQADLICWYGCSWNFIFRTSAMFSLGSVGAD